MHDIDRLVSTENDSPELRNSKEANHIRIRRVYSHNINTNFVLDFGCGNGQFLRDIQELRTQGMGIDKDTDLQLNTAVPGIYDACFMTEVIEHLTNPADIIRQISAILKPGGIIYIETTFSDHLTYPWYKDPYVSPTIGHRTILSIKALKLCLKGTPLQIAEIVNKNVIILKKQ